MMQQLDRVQELEHRVAVLEKLVTVSKQLNSTLNLDQLLAFIMDAAAEITDAEAASVMLVNHNTNELFFAATTTHSTIDIIGQQVPLEGSIAGTILRERRVIALDDAKSAPIYKKIDEDNQFDTRSILGVPMFSKTRSIGVLEAINKKNLPWTTEDQDNLQALAVQAAVAIEVAQLFSALRKANDELSQVDKLKNDFIAIASHELRTPLGVILGYASFLQEETSGNASASGHIDKVINSALKLRKIIEDLTNLRYLQQSAGDLQMASMNVEQLLKDLKFDTLTLLEAKRQKLVLPSDAAQYRVSVDRARIVMALTNILNNAIEFTDDGGTITIDAEGRGSNEVWIKISDQGKGIPRDQLERIFEKFYQIENHMVRHHEGLGIGLSITQALVNVHGGRVWAESGGPGTGATFIVALPLREA